MRKMRLLIDASGSRLVIMRLILAVMVMVRVRVCRRTMCRFTFVECWFASWNDISGGWWLKFALDKVLDDFGDLVVVFVVTILRWSRWGGLEWKHSVNHDQQRLIYM